MRVNQILSEAMTKINFVKSIDFSGRQVAYTCQVEIFHGLLTFALGKFTGGSVAVDESNLTVNEKKKLCKAVETHISKEKLTLDDFGKISQKHLDNIGKAWKILQSYKGQGKQGMIQAMDELVDNDLEDYYDDLK